MNARGRPLAAHPNDPDYLEELEQLISESEWSWYFEYLEERYSNSGYEDTYDVMAADHMFKQGFTIQTDWNNGSKLDVRAVTDKTWREIAALYSKLFKKPYSFKRRRLK